jgi:hypothetical protein
VRRPVQFRRITATGVVFACCIGAWCQQPKEERWSEVNGIRFKIPAGHKESKSRDPRVVIFKYEGMTSSSLIKIYFEHRLTDIPGNELTPEKMKVFGLTKTGERKVTMVGREGGCAEYFLKTKSSVEIRQVECSFGTELHTSFFGSPDRMTEFYEFMQAAELSRKERQT